MDGSGNITDDSRIRAALPTIREVKEKGFNAIVISHMGRPKLVQTGDDTEEVKAQRKKLSLEVAANRLGELLGCDVAFADDCIGEKAESAVAQLPEGGGVLVLQNLRFYKQEEKNVEEFAKQLASLGHAYINDAFGAAHRAHASVSGIPANLPSELCGIGYLMAKEVAFLNFEKAEGSKIVAIIGGSKVSTKLPVIKGLLSKCDVIILSGGLAFTFAKAKGISIGSSLCEDDMVGTANDLFAEADAVGCRLVCPVDAVCAPGFPKEPMDLKDTKLFEMVPGKGIEDGWMGLDVGSATLEVFREAMDGATKVLFNGPMGVFEIEPFHIGTKGLVDILEDITAKGVITVVGGGDSVAALAQFNKTESVTYVSTGGGASLELLAGDELPGVTSIGDVA